MAAFRAPLVRLARSRELYAELQKVPEGAMTLCNGFRDARPLPATQEEAPSKAGGKCGLRRS